MSLQSDVQSALKKMFQSIDGQAESIALSKQAAQSQFATAASPNVQFVTITGPDQVFNDPALFAAFGTIGQQLTGADIMAAMYPLYEECFPIATERTSLEGLCDAMRVNQDEDLQNSNQRTQEGWVIAFDPAKKKVVGGYNTITISTANCEADVKNQADYGSVLIYTFVDPKYRGLDLSNKLADVSETAARKFAAETHNDGREQSGMKGFQLAEQNDPTALTSKDIIEDSMGARICQCLRRFIFNKVYHFGQLDINYVQPALEEGGEPCSGLNIVARNCPAPGSADGRIVHEASPKVVERIIANFFEKSIFTEAGGHENDQSYLNMKSFLADKASKGLSLLVDHDIDFMGYRPVINGILTKVANALNFNKDAYENASMADLGAPPIGKLSALRAQAINAKVSHTQQAGM